MKDSLRRVVAVVVVALLATFALTAILLSLMPAAEAAAPSSPPQGEFEPGSVLVKFKPLTPTLIAEATLSFQGFRTLSTIEGIGVRKVAVPPEKELEAIATLRGNPLVEYAEPDYYRHSLWVPNDTYYAGDQWNMRKINMEAAWNITHGASTVKVAVIDTGLDTTNPDRPV
ncbi:MAG: hypothetical protein Q8P59_01520, partial [Dehalococcoidia bacterium]|nr:hypothetical protein [Dehalococcoidia bacterium]